MRFRKSFTLFISIAFIGCSSVKIENSHKNNSIPLEKKVETSKKVEIKNETKEEIIVKNNNTNFIEVYDPLIYLNKRVYTFNYYLDKYLLIPAVKIYNFLLPNFIEKGVTNFFSNLREINNFTNALLQLKIKRAVTSVLRFGINSTVGGFGLIDVATMINLNEAYEDFGLTLARYGVKNGPYLVLPGLGPTNLRDTIGMLVDSLTLSFTNPYNSLVGLDINHYGISTAKFIDLRKEYESFRYYGTGSPFEYEYIRYILTKYRDIQAGYNNKSEDLIKKVNNIHTKTKEAVTDLND